MIMAVLHRLLLIVPAYCVDRFEGRSFFLDLDAPTES